MMKLYSELSAWWPLLSPPADYAEEVAFFLPAIEGAGLPDSPSLLELGCGGGNNASHMKARFAAVTLTDVSPGMLAVSRALNPECEHVEGDMRALRLGRTFDAVFIHDAICYMDTLEDLRAAMETAFIHCAPGGVALLVPDHVAETYEPSTDHGGEDGEGRSMRYLEWTHPAVGSRHAVDYVYVMREGDGPTIVEHDHHLHGLFPRADWLRLLGEVGFGEVQVLRDSYGRDLFLCRKR